MSEAHCVCGTICKLMAHDTYNTLNSVSKVQVVFGQPVSFVRVLCCGVSALVSQFGSLICNVCDTICWLMAQDK